MRLSILTFIASIGLTTIAMAETATFSVEGMHCSSCKKMIQQSVCKDKDISAKLESCHVELNEKTKVGTVTLISKDKSPIDLKKVESAITSTGDEYKVIKKDIK